MQNNNWDVMKDNLEKLHPQWIAPFQWSVFGQKQRVLIREKSFWKTIPRIGFHLGVYGLVQAGWFCDGLRPSKTPTPSLSQSVFILGHQRSGTTFLHRLLAENAWAHSLALQEMLLPSSSIQWGIQQIGRLDQVLGGHLRTFLDQRQAKAFGALDHIHRVRFNEPEEDEFAMWNMYASDMCINDDPTLLNSSPQDMPKPFLEWSTKQQYTSLMWYRACVQKKLQRVGGQGLYIGKNPRFSRCIPQLNQVFPESKMIVLMRNPLEAIPSRISLMQAIWQHRDPNFTTLSPKQIQWILNNSIELYQRTEADLDSIPANRRIIVGYRALKSHPSATLTRIREQLQLPAYSENVQQQVQLLDQKHYQSKHHYDLGTYGLTESDITTPLTNVIAKHQHLWS